MTAITTVRSTADFIKQMIEGHERMHAAFEEEITGLLLAIQTNFSTNVRPKLELQLTSRGINDVTFGEATTNYNPHNNQISIYLNLDLKEENKHPCVAMRDEPEYNGARYLGDIERSIRPEANRLMREYGMEEVKFEFSPPEDFSSLRSYF